MEIETKKGIAYELTFPMVDSTTPEQFKTGVSPADTAYYKDGAGAWTSLAITDTASEIGATGLYEISLSASEMNHDQIIIKFSVSGAADTAYIFNTRTSLAEDVKGDVQNVLRNETITELSAVPAASPSLHAMIQFLYMLHRNKLTSTATQTTVANDAGTAIGTSTDSDDGTTFTRGEFG